jgi:hypothetical protein
MDMVEAQGDAIMDRIEAEGDAMMDAVQGSSKPQKVSDLLSSRFYTRVSDALNSGTSKKDIIEDNGYTSLGFLLQGSTFQFGACARTRSRADQLTDSFKENLPHLEVRTESRPRISGDQTCINLTGRIE